MRERLNACVWRLRACVCDCGLVGVSANAHVYVCAGACVSRVSTRVRACEGACMYVRDRMHVRAYVRLRMCLCMHVLSVWVRMRVRLWVRARVRSGVHACIYACLICHIGLSNKI